MSISITDVNPSTTRVTFTVEGDYSSTLWCYYYIVERYSNGSVIEEDSRSWFTGTDTDEVTVTGLSSDTRYKITVYLYNDSWGFDNLDEWIYRDSTTFWTDEVSSGGSDDENYFSKRKVVSTNITSSKSSSTTTPEYSIDYVRVKVSQASQIDVRVEGSEDICLYYKLGTTSSNCKASISNNTTPVLNWSKKIDKKSSGAETTSFTMMDGDSYAYAEIGWYEYHGYEMDVDYKITITPLVTNYTITYALGTASKWSDGTTGTKTQTKPSNSSVTLTNYTAITNDGTGTKTITFNGNGATSLTKSSQTSRITAEYTHNGWSTSSGGSKSYELQGTYSTNENVTLYPTFSSTLSYSNITLPTKSECQRTGYTLLGWATSSSATTAAAAPGAEYSVTSTTSTLYAVWELDTYNITVDCNGGSGVSSTTYNINSSTITLGKPTRTGYAFCGWTGTEITSPQETVTIPSGSVGNRSYIAIWAQLIVFNFKNSDTDLLKNATNTQGIAINWYVSQSQIQDFINKINSYCGTSIALSEWQTLDNYNAIVDALNQSSAPAHFSGTTQPNLVKKSKDDYIKAQDLLDLENAFNNRKFI